MLTIYVKEAPSEPVNGFKTGWVGDKNSQNKTDIFLSLTATLHVVIRCDKEEANTIRDWMIKDVMPGRLNKIIEEK